MNIDSSFDGANIDVLKIEDAQDIRLAIRPDAGNESFQWFNFLFHGEPNSQYSLKITNASDASFPEGWKGYAAVATYDRKKWFRLPSSYRYGELTIDLTLNYETIQIAYFPPYSYERHLDIVAKIQTLKKATTEVLGLTLDGRELSMIRIGEESLDKKKIWIIARQHPGETMAQWFMEGLINRLLDKDDPVSTSLLDKAVFYSIPNMNPDGSIRGYLRTNAAGINLNREWLDPSPIRSPEVLHTRNKMEQTGVDFFLDVHGDEAIPYVFPAGCDGIPGFNRKQRSLQSRFYDEMHSASSEFQSRIGYEKEAPGKADLSIASNWVGERFSCLSTTLEMPFKDNLLQPFKKTGWSSTRSALLGHNTIEAIAGVIDELR